MSIHYYSFAEILFLLFASLASIRFYYSDLTVFSSSYRQSSSFSSARRLGVSRPSMFISHLLHFGQGTGIVNGATEECMTTATCSKTTTPSVHPKQQDEETVTTSSVSKKANTSANSITVQGVELPGCRVVDGINLIRNGHGMRSITYFGIGIRIYVAAMYSAKPILSAEQAMGKAAQQQNQYGIRSIVDASRTTTSNNTSNNNNNDPLQLDFTFLRHVSQSRVVSAWMQQLDHSVTYRDYEGYQADRDRFILLASGGSIENHGTQSIQLVGDDTRIIDQGTLKGVIRGRNFQRSFLSMWFGSMAVSEDLKCNLLKGDEHYPADIQQVRGELQQQQQQQELLQQQVLIEA